MMEFEAEREAVLRATLEIDARGLNSGTSGNISVRVADGMLITPSGIVPNGLRAADMVLMGLDGSWAGGALQPSSEWEMHAAIYRAFPKASAVVHAHPDHCVALSCLREPIPAFHYMVAGFGGDDVRCSDYALFGSAALAQAAVEALDGRYACLLANHGMIAYAADLDAAVARTMRLETLARQYMLARGIGRPVLIEGADLDAVYARYKTYGQKG